MSQETNDLGAQNEHFTHFTGFRPARFSKEYPNYSPDRDFCQLGILVNRVIYSLTNDVNLFWSEVADKLGSSLTVPSGEGGSNVGPDVISALNAMVGFINDAYGKRPDGTLIEDPKEFTWYNTSLEKLYKANPHGLVIILGMLGERLLDMLFFGSRQDRLIGREGKYTMGEMMDLMGPIMAAVRDGRPVQENATDALRRATQTAMMTGLTGKQIEHIVNQAVAEAVTK